MSEELHDKLDQMAALCAQQIDTIKKFKHALRIAELAGVPPKELKGMVGTGVIEGPHMRRPWLRATFVLKIDDTKTEIPLADVHHDLWPDDLLAQYRRHKRRVKE
jgi:hypothetical protein